MFVCLFVLILLSSRRESNREIKERLIHFLFNRDIKERLIHFLAHLVITEVKKTHCESWKVLPNPEKQLYKEFWSSGGLTDSFVS